MRNNYSIYNTNTVIINGRIVGGGIFSTSMETKKIEDKKSIGVEGANKITIDSDIADVTILTGDCGTIEAHYYGETCTENNIELSVTKSDDEIKVILQKKEKIFNGNLKLDVYIPKKSFECIFVKCQNGKAEIQETVEAKQIKANTQNGSIQTEACFEKITAQSMNGSIDISIRAKSDIEISASSMNRNVNLLLENIGFCHISTSSMNGIARNSHNATGKYKAIGEVSSMNGNVRIG